MKLNYPPHQPSPCPANDFNIDLDASKEAREEHLRLWEQWNDNFPDDPTGEKYLEDYKSRQVVNNDDDESSNTPATEENAEIVNPEPSPETETPPVETTLRKPLGRPRKHTQGTIAARFLWPAELRDAFASRCQEQGVTMTSVLIQAAKDFIEGIYIPNIKK